MITICAKCKVVLKGDADVPVGSVMAVEPEDKEMSHSLCAPCAAASRAEARARLLSQHREIRERINAGGAQLPLFGGTGR